MEKAVVVFERESFFVVLPVKMDIEIEHPKNERKRLMRESDE